MATIQKRGNSYTIRVSCGYDVNGIHKEQSMTWKPDEGMSQRQIEKELNRQAVMFEEAVNHGYKASAKSLAERHSSSDRLSGLSEVLWSYKQRIRCCKLCLHIEAQEGLAERISASAVRKGSDAHVKTDWIS